MTDLIAVPGTEAATTDAAAETLAIDEDRPLAWAPQEPAPKKRRIGLWIGIGAGVLLLGAGAASMILIAPGTTVAGVAVGGLTPGAAADAIAAHVANMEVTLTDAGDDVVLTGSDLGAQVDAKALADEAFNAHPMWNLGSWMSDATPAAVTLDTDKAESALRDAIPSTFVDAVDAGVSFDAGTGTYVVVPSTPGSGVDLDALTGSLQSAVSDGDSALSYSGAPAAVAATISDEAATSTAETLNTMLGTIGFYVGEERTVPVDAATAASWLSIAPEDGALAITADPAAIQKVVDTLPATVNRAAVNAEAITNSAGKVLKTIVEGVTGRELGDTGNVANAFAEQLQQGNANYALNVNETAFTSTNLFRRIDVDLSEQRAYLYENDQLVNSYAISSGLSGTPTPTGNFTVFAHSALTNMGCFEGAPYCTKDVPWSTWFAPDIAFHGTYWHNNFGTPMSHGCVNMPVDVAKYVYDWAPVGLEVSVHA